MTAYLTVAEVADRYRVKENSIHKMTRVGGKDEPPQIPHLKRKGFRALLFRVDHLDAWDDGAPLEVVDLDGGGRLVRPKADT